MNDHSFRSGHDPFELQSRAEADQRAREAGGRHPSLEGSAADGRRLRAWLPILALMGVVFVVLILMSLPR
jgi:hypothetical protein